MGEACANPLKFFVSNLPERCSSLEIGEFFGNYGEVVGVHVARKRDKNGNRFGFVSFMGVKSSEEMEKKLKGVKWGNSKLWVNVARFAVENGGFPRQSGSVPKDVNASGLPAGNCLFNLRDGRTFSEVLGKAKGVSIGASDVGGGSSWGCPKADKTVIVPDRTVAFKDLYGVAVVGRTANLETLVDFKRLLKIAKTDFQVFFI